MVHTQVASAEKAAASPLFRRATGFDSFFYKINQMARQYVAPPSPIYSPYPILFIGWHDIRTVLSKRVELF